MGIYTCGRITNHRSLPRAMKVRSLHSPATNSNCSQQAMTVRYSLGPSFKANSKKYLYLIYLTQCTDGHNIRDRHHF